MTGNGGGYVWLVVMHALEWEECMGDVPRVSVRHHPVHETFSYKPDHRELDCGYILSSAAGS